MRLSISALPVLLSAVAAELTFSATATHHGVPIDVSALEFVPIPPQGSAARYQQKPPAAAAAAADADSATGPRRWRRPNVSYSSDWCGVSRHTGSSNPITNIFGMFAVPSLSLRPGAGLPQTAAAWIGIDGASCQSTLLQAGATTIVNFNGGNSPSVWWQWVPHSSYTITGFPVHINDWIAVNITVTSPTNGKIVMTNLNQNYSLTLVINDGPALCRQDADWILEQYHDANGLVNLARFDRIWFEQCSASTASGEKLGIDANSLIYIGGDDIRSATCLAAYYDDATFYTFSQG